MRTKLRIKGLKKETTRALTILTTGLLTITALYTIAIALIDQTYDIDWKISELEEQHEYYNCQYHDSKQCREIISELNLLRQVKKGGQ